MTKEEIIIANKLIAEFIGGISEPKGYLLFGEIPDKECEQTHFFHPEEMLFHSSWDWLMTVLEKIMDICKVSLEEWYKYREVREVLGTLVINDTYKAVIHFINNHNKETKQS